MLAEAAGAVLGRKHPIKLMSPLNKGNAKRTRKKRREKEMMLQTSTAIRRLLVDFLLNLNQMLFILATYYAMIYVYPNQCPNKLA